MKNARGVVFASVSAGLLAGALAHALLGTPRAQAQPARPAEVGRYQVFVTSPAFDGKNAYRPVAHVIDTRTGSVWVRRTDDVEAADKPQAQWFALGSPVGTK